MSNLRTFRRKLNDVRGQIIMASLMLRDAVHKRKDQTVDGRSVYKNKKGRGRRNQARGWFVRFPMPF